MNEGLSYTGGMTAFTEVNDMSTSSTSDEQASKIGKVSDG